MSNYKSYRHKPRVDWDAEIDKTEKIRRRGIVMSVLSLCVALAVIFGVGRYGAGVDIIIPKSVLATIFFIAAFIVIRAVIKHRMNGKNKNNLDS